MLTTAPLLLYPAASANAGPCDCDFVIEPSTQTANGTELGVGPGDSVCVRGGEREFLRLYDFVGSPDERIVIRNCEGVVEIDNDDRGYGLTLDGSRYLQITGTGDDAHDYGFRVRATRDGPDYSASGVVVGGMSSDYELDHMEVYESGFAGFSLKTEPVCDGSANLGNFIQYDTHVHDNWIHDTRGEGIYYGSTQSAGQQINCDGDSVTVFPHEHHGVYIHHNLIENTGWDGMQVGVSPVDCKIWSNWIRDVGLEGVQYQWQAMQIGGGSQCEIWGNRLERGPANGIFILRADSSYVHDNLVVDFGETGIYANANELYPGSQYVFVHNTVLRSSRWGIAVFGDELVGNLGWNNLVLESGEADIAAAATVDWDAQANLTGMSVAEVGFVDPEAGDYRLSADSLAVEAGRAAQEWSTADILGVPRDVDKPDVGAYEFTTEPPPGDGDGDGDGGPGPGPGGDDGDDGSGDGPGDAGGSGETGAGASEDGDAGCGCTSNSAPAPLGFAVAGLGLLLLRRRRSSPDRTA